MRLFSLAGCLLLATAATATRAQSLDLFDNFARDWRSHWQEQSLLAGTTVYEATAIEGRPALRGSSQASASSLYRRLDLPAPPAARLRWSWRVLAPVPLTVSERTKAGDDYAVRVTVVFEAAAIPMRSRALQYVWATREPVGSVFPNPYSANVGMIVLRSGAAETGAWRDEDRDILADYERFFGHPPKQISAVAIMTDSDNSHTKAEGWFAGLKLELDSTPIVKKP